MDLQKELELFLDYYMPNQSSDIRDAVELDKSFHVINVPKLLAVSGLDESYVLRLTDSWNAWQAAKAHEAEKLKGCVLVPVQCPDPDFADSLFDELSKKAIGEFGDDLLIHFSDIDEEKIWALMVEAAKAQAVLEWISVEDGLPSDGQNIIAFDAIKHCVFKDGEFLQGYFEPDTGHEYTEPVDVTHWIAIEPQEPTND